MLLQKIDQTSSVSRKQSSGHLALSGQRPTLTSYVANLICSQENDPGTGESPREIKKETRYHAAQYVALLDTIFRLRFSSVKSAPAV